MIEIIKRLIASTIGAFVARETRRLLRMVVCGIAAAVFLTPALYFLVVAGYLRLRLYFPPIETALLMAGALFILALLCLLPLAFSGRRRRRVPKTPVGNDVVSFVDLLRATGLPREAGNLIACVRPASQIRQLYLAAASVLVGLILDRRLRPGGPTENHASRKGPAEFPSLLTLAHRSMGRRTRFW